jgi:hypothetical protein
MKPFYRDNLVNGPYTLDGRTLKFRTKGSLLGADAARALRSGNRLTVCIYTAAGLKEITGQVVSADLKRGTPPTEWDVKMKVQLLRRS